jgi:hypothetical protein
VRSSFTSNRAANGSAVLLLQPVGMSQLQDCSFENNQPRPGVTADAAQVQRKQQQLSCQAVLFQQQQQHRLQQIQHIVISRKSGL